MIRRLRSAVLAVALMAAAATSASGAKGWEPVRSDVTALNVAARDAEVEMRVTSGYVVVVASQPTQIKVFTILGQTVSSENIPQGVSRLPLSHGVYIVKVGDLTCKIAV